MTKAKEFYVLIRSRFGFNDGKYRPVWGPFPSRESAVKYAIAQSGMACKFDAQTVRIVVDADELLQAHQYTTEEAKRSINASETEHQCQRNGAKQ